MLNKKLYRKSLLVTSTILLLVGSVAFTSYAAELPPLTHKLTAIKKIIKAPGLRLKNLDDEIIDIKDLQGKIIVVNFWATWCPPCRREMGSLERLHLATKDKNVVVLAVDIGEDLDTVFSFMGQVEPSPTFSILLDLDATVMKRWKVKGLPTTFVVSPDGNIAYRAVGGRELDHPDIQWAILKLNK